MYPANAVIPHEANRPAIGLQLALINAEPLTFEQAAREAGASTLDAFVRVVQSLWTLLKQAIEGTPNVTGVVGPVGLVSVIGDAAHTGIGSVLALAAFISINLSVINLLPIPILDGGRIVLLAVEAVLRREAPRLAVQLFNTLGVALILLLMLVVTYHDIARLLM
jgi:regulator of sigma E protease